MRRGHGRNTMTFGWRWERGRRTPHPADLYTDGEANGGRNRGIACPHPSLAEGADRTRWLMSRETAKWSSKSGFPARSEWKSSGPFAGGMKSESRCRSSAVVAGRRLWIFHRETCSSAIWSTEHDGRSIARPTASAADPMALNAAASGERINERPDALARFGFRADAGHPTNRLVATCCDDRGTRSPWGLTSPE